MRVLGAETLGELPLGRHTVIRMFQFKIKEVLIRPSVSVGNLVVNSKRPKKKHHHGALSLSQMSTNSLEQRAINTIIHTTVIIKAELHIFK